jgi:DNA transposition AAA+ family ATPase
MSVVEMPAKKTAPAGGTARAMSETRVQAARQWLAEFYNASGLSWEAIGKQLGKSGATFNLFVNEKYNAQPDEVVLAIERFREMNDARSSVVLDPTFVETSIAEDIMKALKRTEILRRVALIAAESGLGKTTVIREWCRLNPKAIYIYCTPVIAKPGAIIAELRYLVTNDQSRKYVNGLTLRQIVHALAGTGRTLIFDEAQFLSAEALDMLRCIHDQAGVPMVFSGNESVYELGPRGQSGQAAFVQFTSRCAIRLMRKASQITRKDVELIADQMLSADVAKDALDLLLSQAQRSGGFRRLVILLQLAQTMVEGRDQISKGHITRAMKELVETGGAL